MKKICASSRRTIDTFVFTPLIIIFFIKIHFIPVGEAVPILPLSQGLDLDVGNNSLVAGPSPIGCRYQGSVYSASEEVPTEEPCLLCACKTSAVVCKLRICPEISVPPPPGCIIVHKARKCCAQLVCHQNMETNRKFSREQKLPAVNSSLPTISAEGTKGFCVLDGTVYAEGSAMQNPRSPSLCQYCFCIRGEMRCSSPKCVIPLNGCKPRFRSYACCPTNYDCVESNTTAIVKTTTRTSTPTPEFLKGCLVNGKRVQEGEPVLPLQLENHTNPCQTCFCMGGVIHCAPLECDKAIDGCKPILEPGHCCPDRYDCNFTATTERITTTMTTTTTTPTTTKILMVESPTTTESPEPLPKPASQKLKSSGEEVAATSTEVKANGSGSREDRRNKSYEDDEKEDSSSISFEQDTNSMSFEDSTDQSASNSEESETEIPPTEENNIDIEATATDTSVLLSEKPISETLEGRIVSTKNPTSVHEVVTSASSLLSITSSSSTISSTTVTTTTTEASVPIIANTTEGSATVYNSSLGEEAGTTNISPPSSGGGISDLHESDTDTAMESSTLSIINQDDVENLSEVSAPTTTTTTPSTTASTSTSSRPVQLMETTVKNVHFIPFGVEDALEVSPMNGTNPLFESGSPPLNLAYDSHALKISLIPPNSTPPKGYERVPLHQTVKNMGGGGTISGAPQSQQQTAALPSTLSAQPLVSPMTIPRGGGGGSGGNAPPPPPATRNDLRNAIMDVPVSTSLYSNGFYRNGIITEDRHRAPSELQSRRPFPGQVFEDADDDDHSYKDAILPPPSNKKVIYETTTQLVPPSLSNNNPARTYSKFGIQDSTFHRYGGYRNTNGPTVSSTLPPSKIVNQQQQQHHHRYYNAPEQEQHPIPPSQNPYYAVASEELAYDEVEEEEGQSIEEQSVEDLDNHFNYEKPMIHSNPPPTTPPIYVLAQSGTNNNDHMAIMSSTKSPSSISLLKISGYSNSSNHSNNNKNRIGYTPVVAFPFNLPKRPDFNLGLKLSGCNISGKMYNIGDIIRELSSPCVRCLCTEVGGVQCNEIPCRPDTNYNK